MIRLLAIQSTYHAIEYALYEEERVVGGRVLDKLVASSNFIPSLDILFASVGWNLSDLSFIAVNCGPAPFTTLRVLIATVNGLQYVSKVPLLSINGFDVWFGNVPDASVSTAILMNAFNRQVYVAFRAAGEASYTCWCGSIESVVAQLCRDNLATMRLVGNAIDLYRDLFEQAMANRWLYEASDITNNSLQHVARLGLQAWRQGTRHNEPVTPLYLKSHY